MMNGSSTSYYSPHTVSTQHEEATDRDKREHRGCTAPSVRPTVFGQIGSKEMASAAVLDLLLADRANAGLSTNYVHQGSNYSAVLVSHLLCYKGAAWYGPSLPPCPYPTSQGQNKSSLYES